MRLLRSSLLIGCLLLPSIAFAALIDPALRWKTVETAHFALHYYEGEEEIAARLMTISEESYRILSEKFAARPWGKTEVVIVDNQDRANAFTQVIPYNLIILRVVPPAADNILADYDDWLRELFIHEYTHVIHITDTRYPAKLLKFIFGTLVAPNGLSPGWVTEGIATYVETAETTRGRGRSSFTDMLLRTDILQGKFLHLDQMAGTQYDWPNWLAQYLYGVRFWQFLADRYGEEKIIEFSHRYGASLRFLMLNSQAKKVFGKSFYRLWDEWKSTLEERYRSVKEELEKKGLNEGDVFLKPQKGESFTLPVISKDGRKIAYCAASVDHRQELRLRDLENGNEKILLKKKDISQISFSPDGEKILVSYVRSYKKYSKYSDLYEIAIESKKAAPITQGKRARDPDESPDGKKIVAVLQETGRSRLGIYDRESKEWKIIFEAHQLDHPRWLPDSRSIVISAHDEKQRDLWIISVDGKNEKRITTDVALEDRPAVDPKGRSIYFSSDRTGISNLYRYDLKTGHLFQMTNVLTGAFSPAVGPKGEVVFQYYHGGGFEIRTLGNREGLPTGRLTSAPPPQPRQGGAAVGPLPVRHAFRKPLPVSPKNYNPFKKLFVPRYLFPNAAFLDGSVFLSATVSNYDPLYRHLWFGDVTYRSDNSFVGYDVGYTYSRYLPSIFVGFSDLAVNYGDVFRLGSDFFEERKRAYSGLSLPLGSHGFLFQYFFENRSEESGLPAGTTVSTLGRYSGLHAQYSFSKTGATAAAISPEEGERLSLNFQITDHLLGSSEALEQRVAWGDARTYLRMPYSSHHVLAFRAAGGAAFGDQFLQGNFGLGGSIGESPFSGTSTRLFTLRGLPVVTFSRDRAWVGSVEYRMPLFRVQRGLGTLPFAMNSAHCALFADIGDAFNQGNPSFRPLLGVGAELRGDFVVGWHLPLMGRLGYGVIVTNRDRIAGATDSLTGADARNGVLILEVGTSF